MFLHDFDAKMRQIEAKNVCFGLAPKRWSMVLLSEKHNWFIRFVIDSGLKQNKPFIKFESNFDESSSKNQIDIC